MQSASAFGWGAAAVSVVPVARCFIAAGASLTVILYNTLFVV